MICSDTSVQGDKWTKPCQKNTPHTLVGPVHCLGTNMGFAENMKNRIEHLIYPLMFIRIEKCFVFSIKLD